MNESKEAIEMPKALTSENGAKSALMGEFSFQVYKGDGEYLEAVVPWSTIKEIYRYITVCVYLGDIK